MEENGGSVELETDYDDQNVSLRPNCEPKSPMVENLNTENEAVGLEHKSLLGRKRHHSTSHNLSLPPELSLHSSPLHIDSRISWIKSKAHLSSEAMLEVNLFSEKHCSKLFSLKPADSHCNVARTLFQLPPSQRVFSHPPWQVEKLQQLKVELNKVKGDTERGEDLSSWTDHTFRVNPAMAVFKRVKEKANPEFISQAFLKFYEVLCQFPLVLPGTDSLSSLHLCEAPGAFIIALNHYIQYHHPDIQWEWLGNTLHPHYEGSKASECISDDRIILHTLMHWVFGRDGTGNITLRSCLEDLTDRCSKLKEPVSLVTADGSIDCQDNPGEQEVTTNHLHQCEVLAALHLLSPGGNLVVKMFTFFESSSVCLLYLICCAFSEVQVFKPITSKLGNSEVYVVGLNYVGREEISVTLDELLKHYLPQAPSMSMFALEDIPSEFVKVVVECARFFKEHQENAIERNARLYLDTSEEAESACQIVQELVWRKFQVRNPIGPIPTNRRILQVDVRWDGNVHPDFGKHKRWSGCIQRLSVDKKLDRISELLLDFVEAYASREHRDLYYKTEDSILENLRLVKGLPFQQVGNSRFCCERSLNLYSVLSSLKCELVSGELLQNKMENKSQKVLYLQGNNKTDHESALSDFNDDTKKLVESVMKDYPDCTFLIDEYPDGSAGPAPSCDVLDRLHELLESHSLPAGATVHLTNMPLLTRLQNGLFVVLSSCFKNVDLHQTLYHFLNSGQSLPPVLKLENLNLDSARRVLDALKDVGWSRGAHKRGVMELLDTFSLIHNDSHKVVCRYNSNLMLIWSSDLLKQIKNVRGTLCRT
ncbi:cap-specific mRNA (nucleoside-2'-O-)-methyltransferase 2 isoform X2 [Hyalella azteca]|uniref:Cap-specific mRNA (nucleoside-2'-O-)-methyltransferase 2 n=1 Tax=Hyalella azteca TaxID=294128 RepID=A0A979FY50_HYAAZ|nr:cap-specific mRNA (nucleoside-2'-O-)-methyltransferase 2 isoform X2 [Hyalella azteca]